MNYGTDWLSTGSVFSSVKKAKEFLLHKGYDAKNGVRPLRRLIQETLEDHLSLAVLDERYHKGDVIKIGLKNNELTYERLTETAPTKLKALG